MQVHHQPCGERQHQPETSEVNRSVTISPRTGDPVLGEMVVVEVVSPPHAAREMATSRSPAVILEGIVGRVEMLQAHPIRSGVGADAQ